MPRRIVITCVAIKNVLVFNYRLHISVFVAASIPAAPLEKSWRLCWPIRWPESSTSSVTEPSMLFRLYYSRTLLPVCIKDSVILLTHIVRACRTEHYTAIVLSKNNKKLSRCWEARATRVCLTSSEYYFRFFGVPEVEIWRSEGIWNPPLLLRSRLQYQTTGGRQPYCR